MAQQLEQCVPLEYQINWCIKLVFVRAQTIFDRRLITTTYTVFHKNLNSLNFAAVMVSLFTGGIVKFSSVLLSAWVVECEPWINIVLENPVFSSFFLLQNYLLVPWLQFLNLWCKIIFYTSAWWSVLPVTIVVN